MPLTQISEHPESYNLFLYHARTNMGLKMKAFAEKLGIGAFRYRLIENGYLKPDKELVERVSSLLGVDYAPCTINEYSYPGEKPEKKARFAKLFDFIGSKGFKIAMAVLCVVCLGVFILSAVSYRNTKTSNRTFYSDEYLRLSDALIENGSTSLSVTGSWVRPEVFSAGGDKFVAIIGEYDPERLGALTFRTVYWTDTYRCILIASSAVNGEVVYTVRIAEYADNNEAVCTYIPGTGLISSADVSKYDKAVGEYISKFFYDYDILIRNELSMDVSSKALLLEQFAVSETVSKALIAPLIGYLLGLVFCLLALFGLIYSFVYGTKNGVGRDLRYQFKLYEKGAVKPKTDIRFLPFIPESVVAIIGIALLAVANVRFQIYLVLAFSPSGAGLSLDEIKAKYDLLMLIFYAAMFLHYFVDFDLFTDDKRVIRNIAAFGLAFVGIYTLELGFLKILNPDSLLFRVVGDKLPNVFGTITMYFLILFFLFFTPKIIDTKKKLVIFRSLSVIPVIIIFGTYIIFNGANSSFGWDLPNWAFYLFASQRISFSLLCVLYLFGLFFLRMHYRKKLGDEIAANYFNGNRFLFLKNFLVCAIIVLISAADLIMARNATAKAWGFGRAYYTLFLIPLLLFYHPHKGPRNKAADIAIIVLYFLTLTGVVSFVFLSDTGIV